jgi:hypothetical protein
MTVFPVLENRLRFRGNNPSNQDKIIIVITRMQRIITERRPGALPPHAPGDAL